MKEIIKTEEKNKVVETESRRSCFPSPQKFSFTAPTDSPLLDTYRVFKVLFYVKTGITGSRETAYVRKHLTRGFLCAVLDLSGTLWPLLIPECAGIKRRGTPFPGLRKKPRHFSLW